MSYNRIVQIICFAIIAVQLFDLYQQLPILTDYSSPDDRWLTFKVCINPISTIGLTLVLMYVLKKVNLYRAEEQRPDLIDDFN